MHPGSALGTVVMATECRGGSGGFVPRDFDVGAFHGAWRRVWLRTVKLWGFLGVRSVASLWGLLGKVAAPET